MSTLENEAVKREMESYQVQVQALQAQLEEQTRLYKEQTEALMEDRSIRQEETETQRGRDQEKIQALSEKWDYYFVVTVVVGGFHWGEFDWIAMDEFDWCRMEDDG